MCHEAHATHSAVYTTALTHSLVAAEQSAAGSPTGTAPVGWVAVPRNGLGHPLHAPNPLDTPPGRPELRVTV